ncbi:MAG: matrixin family metalloprotease [Nitrososphaeraceae archaeon]
MSKLILILFLLTAIIFVSFSIPTPHQIQAANEEDFEVNNSVMICCTWGEKLKDGKLTYNIEGEVSAEKKEAVRDAIRDWDDMVNFVEFIEIPEKDEAQQKEKPDIQIKFLKDGSEFEENGAETAGHTKTKLNKFGFIKFNLVTIAEGGLGKIFDKKTIETIAKHEIGHTLGLGHANFKSNLMTTKIDFAAETISQCELEAVQQANSWKFLAKNNNDDPRLSSTSKVNCES